MSQEPAFSLHRLRPSQRFALLWLLLAGLFVRGLIAPGTMPQFGPHGVSIVLCTPSGAKTVWKADEAAGQAASADTSCSFALALGLAGFVVAAAALELPAAGPAVAALPPAARAARPDRSGSARGPPLHS